LTRYLVLINFPNLSKTTHLRRRCQIQIYRDFQ
jgi:hypothetical protein